MEISTTYNKVERIEVRLSVSEIEEAVNSYISKKVPAVNRINGTRSMEFVYSIDEYNGDEVVGVLWKKVREKEETTTKGLPTDDEKAEVIP